MGGFLVLQRAQHNRRPGIQLVNTTYGYVRGTDHAVREVFQGHCLLVNGVSVERAVYSVRYVSRCSGTYVIHSSGRSIVPVCAINTGM